MSRIRLTLESHRTNVVSRTTLYILCIYPVILLSRVFSLFQYVKDQLSQVLSVRIEHYIFIVFYILYLFLIYNVRTRVYAKALNYFSFSSIVDVFFGGQGSTQYVSPSQFIVSIFSIG